MPRHQIFNERPESQDRALRELQAMGYQYIPRAEAEQKRGHLSHVLFPDVMREFLASQSFIYRGKQTPFPDDAIGEAIRELDAPLERGLMFSSKAIYDRLIYGKSCDVHLYDGNTQSFDISYIDWEHPENNIWQVTDEFSVERTNGKYARPDIVLLVNGIPLVVIECKKSSVDVEEGVKQNVRNWQPDYIPQLFKFTQLAIAMNPESVKYGTAGTKQEFYCKWHEEDVQWQEEAAKRYVDDGHITDSQGRKIDFKNTVVIMTSNAGAENIIAPRKLGFTSQDDEEAKYKRMKTGVMDEVKRLFKPEFLNRIDDIIVFHALSKDEIREIAGLLFSQLAQRCEKQMGIILKPDKNAKELISSKGFDAKYGARPLKRALQNLVEDPLSEEILSGRVKSGDTLRVGCKDDKITFSVKKA